MGDRVSESITNTITKNTSQECVKYFHEILKKGCLMLMGN